MRQVAVVGYARTEPGERMDGLSEVEMLLPVLHDALGQVGLKAGEIGFTCSGSSDYLAGRPFSFTLALDGVGAWPPISESHVEMDGAFALYEAWVKLLTGEADTALVYAWGRPSAGDLPEVLTRQLDPYYLAPLWPDAHALAGLQARALAETGAAGGADTAAPVSASVGDAPPAAADGAAAVVLAADAEARRLCPRPAWIRGMDHRIEAHALGVRDLADSPSTRLAAERAGAYGRPADTVELHAAYPHEEALLRAVLRLDDAVAVNPSGPGPGPYMAAGLVRIGEAAARIHRGESARALGHATSGPCLQQNLVAVLEQET